MSGQVFFTASCPMVIFRCKDTKFFLEIQIFLHIYRRKRIEICPIDIFKPIPVPLPLLVLVTVIVRKRDLLGRC